MHNACVACNGRENGCVGCEYYTEFDAGLEDYEARCALDQSLSETLDGQCACPSCGEPECVTPVGWGCSNQDCFLGRYDAEERNFIHEMEGGRP